MLLKLGTIRDDVSNLFIVPVDLFPVHVGGHIRISSTACSSGNLALLFEAEVESVDWPPLQLQYEQYARVTTVISSGNACQNSHLHADTAQRPWLLLRGLLQSLHVSDPFVA